MHVWRQLALANSRYQHPSTLSAVCTQEKRSMWASKEGLGPSRQGILGFQAPRALSSGGHTGFG